MIHQIIKLFAAHFTLIYDSVTRVFTVLIWRHRLNRRIENKLHLCKRRNDGKYNRKFLFFY